MGGRPGCDVVARERIIIVSVHDFEFNFIMAVYCSIRGRISEEEEAYVMDCGCGPLLSHPLMS